MQSLALLVALLLILMISAALGALFLTFKKTRALSNVTAKPLQRISTIFLASVALLIGLQFATQVDSLGGRLIGGFGIATALVAFYRVFKR
ncbi:MAG: phosphatase [Actinomycetes bacterium]